MLAAELVVGRLQICRWSSCVLIKYTAIGDKATEDLLFVDGGAGTSDENLWFEPLRSRLGIPTVNKPAVCFERTIEQCRELLLHFLQNIPVLFILGDGM